MLFRFPDWWGRISALPLLVARILANHAHNAATADDLALPANLAY
jgi:hypothetical protein